MQLEKEDLDFLNELPPSDLYEYVVSKGTDMVPTKELLDQLCVDDNRVYGCQSLVWVNRIAVSYTHLTLPTILLV